MTDAMLTGAATAIVTPFTRDGAVDQAALAKFVAWQVEEGIDFLVPCGSTGEAATMSLDERLAVVRITAETVANRVAVVAGAGGNATRRSVASSRISGRSPTPARCRSSSTTFPAGRRVTSKPRRPSRSPNIRIFARLRKRRGICRRSSRSFAMRRTGSRCSRATTRSRSA
jgi:hypothetical protein